MLHAANQFLKNSVELTGSQKKFPQVWGTQDSVFQGLLKRQLKVHLGTILQIALNDHIKSSKSDHEYAEVQIKSMQLLFF